MKLKYGLVLIGFVLLGSVSARDSNSITVRGHRISKGDTADSVFETLTGSDMLGQDVNVDPRYIHSMRVTKRYRVEGKSFVIVFTRERESGPYVVSSIDTPETSPQRGSEKSGNKPGTISSAKRKNASSKSATRATSVALETVATEPTSAQLPPVTHGGSVDTEDCKPTYPKAARRNEQTGLVTLRFTVSPAGQVLGSYIVRSTGFRDLDMAAREALSKCTFHAEVVNGQRVITEVDVQYSFSLED